MINDIIKHIFRFIFLVLLQVLILDNIQLGGYINPYLYVLFVLLLPFETPIWLLMVLGFLIGISVDMFLSTMGLHAAATVFMAYSRSYVLKFFSPRDGYESSAEPSLQYLGFNWFASYSAIMVALHHFVFFFLESFRFSEFFSTLTRATLSSIFTIGLVLLSQYLTLKGRNKK
jgi:rod shape-determining protein MreD